MDGQNMQERMYGVVLWADASDRKAVIWCEDHGNLAYYSAGEQSMHCGVSLDAGDLIQFDLREERDFRQASNLERVGSGYAPGLVASLRRAEPVRPSVDTTDNVVAFPARRCN